MFSREVADAICQRLADGESLNAICKTEGMPAESTVRAWALDDVEGFAANYARARAIGYERLADELLSIADTPVVGVKTKTNDKGETETTEGDMIEHRRLQVDARKWMLAKMLPKKFGDKIETTVQGPNGGPVKNEHAVTISAEEAYKRMLGGE
jgi:hypothetical protein